jgi:hypothetical protein
MFRQSGDIMETLSVSWTKIRNWNECKQKSHLIAQGKRSKVMDYRVFFAGEICDRVMIEWLSNPQPKTMPAMVDAHVEKRLKEIKSNQEGVVRWKSFSDRVDITKFCKILVTKLEPILNKLVLPYKFEAPRRFSSLLSIPYLDNKPVNIQLRGEMDLFVYADKGFAVWDLKGTANKDYWRKTIGQLVFYDLGVFTEFSAFPIRTGLIQPMCDNQVLQLSISQEDRVSMLGQIIRYAHSVWKEDFALKVSSEGCSYCSVKHACPRYTRSLFSGPIHNEGTK